MLHSWTAVFHTVESSESICLQSRSLLLMEQCVVLKYWLGISCTNCFAQQSGCENWAVILAFIVGKFVSIPIFHGAFKKYAIVNTVSKEEVSSSEIRRVSFLDRLNVGRKVYSKTENGPLAFSKTEQSFLVHLFDCKLKWLIFFSYKLYSWRKIILRKEKKILLAYI